MPSFVMTATLLWEVWEEEKVLLKFWIWENKSSSEKERDKWKLILPEKWLTILKLGKKRGLRGSKYLWTLLRHSFTSLIGLLRFAYCLTVSLDIATLYMSQTSFGHISTNSSTILTVSIATKSPWKDLSINTSHVLRRSIKAKILGRSTGNHHSTVY